LGPVSFFPSRAQETRLDPAPFAPSRHARHRGKYGRAWLTRELREAGFRVNHKRVRRLMLREGLQARRRRRFVCTADSGHSLPVAPNLLERDFSARAPNEKWVADITHVETAEDWLYVALVMDLFSRPWSAGRWGEKIDGALTAQALALALGLRDPPSGLVHHSAAVRPARTPIAPCSPIAASRCR